MYFPLLILSFGSILLFLTHLYQHSFAIFISHLSGAHHFLIKITGIVLQFTSLRSCYLPWINYRKTCWLIDVACQKEDNCIFSSSLKGHAHRVIGTATDNLEIKCILKRCAILQPWYMDLNGFFSKYKSHIQLQ